MIKTYKSNCLYKTICILLLHINKKKEKLKPKQLKRRNEEEKGLFYKLFLGLQNVHVEMQSFYTLKSILTLVWMLPHIWDPDPGNGSDLIRVSVFFQSRFHNPVFIQGITQCDTLKVLDQNAQVVMFGGIFDTRPTMAWSNVEWVL